MARHEGTKAPVLQVHSASGVEGVLAALDMNRTASPDLLALALLARQAKES
jgi:hypothetical protein